LNWRPDGSKGWQRVAKGGKPAGTGPIRPFAWLKLRQALHQVSKMKTTVFHSWQA